MGLTWFLLLSSILVVVAFQQKITYYYNKDYTGPFIVVTSTNRDLAREYQTIMNTTMSYCADGMWFEYLGKDFDLTMRSSGTWSNQTYCYQFWDPNPMPPSIRHVGPSNTLTPGLTLYERPYGAGREYYITNTVSFLPFPPVQWASSGRTDWTFFEGESFSGNATCKLKNIYTDVNYGGIDPLAAVGSVVKGCGLEAERNLAAFKLEN